MWPMACRRSTFGRGHRGTGLPVCCRLATCLDAHCDSASDSGGRGGVLGRADEILSATDVLMHCGT